MGFAGYFLFKTRLIEAIQSAVSLLVPCGVLDVQM
jgi:hypothetical protein